MRFHEEWIDATVRAVADVGTTVREIELAPEGGTQLYGPGAHVNFSVLIDGLPDTRSYSLVGPPGEVYRIAVKLLPESRGGSRYMWSLAPGARIRMTQPRNHFELGFGRPEYLLIAGGIGITPLVGMALALAGQNAPMRMVYTARSRDDMPYAGQLAQALGTRLATFSNAQGEWLDVTGEIDRLHPEGEVYVCGPIGLLEAVKRAWADAGRPAGKLRYETFGNSGRYAAEAFTVRVPNLGREVVVPENRTMLAALQEAGVEMMYDCLRGECGLCAVDILACDGIVDHRDVFLSGEQQVQNRKICACVSRVVRGSVCVDVGYRGQQAAE